MCCLRFSVNWWYQWRTISLVLWIKKTSSVFSYQLQKTTFQSYMFFSITLPCFSAYGRPNIHWQVGFQTTAWKLTFWKCFCKASSVAGSWRHWMFFLLVKVRQTLSIVGDSLDIPNGILLVVEKFLCAVYALFIARIFMFAVITVVSDSLSLI
jgi:hypothetical protein